MSEESLNSLGSLGSIIEDSDVAGVVEIDAETGEFNIVSMLKGEITDEVKETIAAQIKDKIKERKRNIN